MRLRGATALVTGGAGGIGCEVAGAFARRGARVVLWDRPGAALEAAAADVRRFGPVRTAVVDVTDPREVREAAAALEAEGWGIDVLDANAGLAFPGELLDADEAKLAATIRVNLDAVIWCLRAFVPAMIDRGRGHIVLMGSASSFTGVPGLAAYAATKHGVIGLAESLRLELRRRGRAGIGMTIACPGFVKTPMFDGVRPPLLLPWLDPARVGELIADAVEADRRYLREPWLVRWLPALRAVSPPPIYDRVGDWLGLGRTDERWAGRAAASR